MTLPSYPLCEMQLDFHHDRTILGVLVDEMADGLFTVDAKAQFVAWSDGAERITGYSREEVVGRLCRMLEGVNCQGFAVLQAREIRRVGDTSALPVNVRLSTRL